MKTTTIIDSKKKPQPLLPLNRSKTNIQAKTEKIKFTLTKEEEKTYGDRFPAGYKKLRILGRGGCAIVWLGEDLSTGKKFAIKQISRFSGPNAIESSKREIHIGTLLNESDHPASGSLIKLLDSKIEKSDLWAFYEIGGTSLSKALFQVKGEFVKGERMYRIEHPVLYEFFKDIRNFQMFLQELIQAIDYFTELNIVHSDLKPDNILVNTEKYDGIKIIDFGSAFNFYSNGAINTATPEYMPPEALEIAHSPGDHIGHLASFCQPWSFDMWSAGMIALEIVTGVPLWMSLKSRVNKFGKLVFSKGLLAANARNPETIFKLMHEVTADIRFTVGKYAAFDVPGCLVELIGLMLTWDPALRISPKEALAHEFFRRGLEVCN